MSRGPVALRRDLERVRAYLARELPISRPEPRPTVAALALDVILRRLEAGTYGPDPVSTSPFKDRT